MNDGKERFCGACANYRYDGVCMVWSLDDSSGLLRPTDVVDEENASAFMPVDYFSCHVFENTVNE